MSSRHEEQASSSTSGMAITSLKVSDAPGESRHSPDQLVPLYEPWLGREEARLVMQALRSGWISSAGPLVPEFEDRFAFLCGVRHAIAVSSGTAALHVTLHALGIGPGDEVLVPTLTFVATANAVRYTGATPVFVDSEWETWGMDPEDAERKITGRTRALIPVHLYGHPARMPAILELAKRRGLLVVEDASEAHFASVNGRYVGALGAAGVFSFFGNKAVTTGEGGMVVTDDSALAERVRYLIGQAMSPQRRYWHGELGFNYRMTNLQAAVGLAQLSRLEEILRRKRRIAMWYRHVLDTAPDLVMPPELPGYRNIYWLFSFLMMPQIESSARVAQRLASRGVDTRPFFVPIHSLPPYAGDWGPFPVAASLARRGLSLPSGPRLNHATVTHVAQEVLEALLAEGRNP